MTDKIAPGTLKPGDVVLVRMVVREWRDHPQVLQVSAVSNKDALNDGFVESGVDIVSIEPRPLAVGDQVTDDMHREEGGGTIVAVDHAEAWVRWSNLRGGIYPVETLRRIP